MRESAVDRDDASKTYGALTSLAFSRVSEILLERKKGGTHLTPDHFAAPKGQREKTYSAFFACTVRLILSTTCGLSGSVGSVLHIFRKP